jgi:hypothetical protein
MTTLDDILAPTIASCVCPECGTAWLGEIASALVANLGTADGKVSVWCEPCQAKPVIRTAKAAPERFDDRWDIMCPDEYRLTTEGGNTDRERLKHAKGETTDGIQMKAGQIAELIHSRRPVLLAGQPGTMKTRLAWRMVRMIWDTAKAVRCFSSWQFQAELQDASSEFGASKWMANLLNSELVFIDDLGKAEWTANTHGAFFELLEARIVRRKPLLITTNETFESIRDARSDHKSAVAKSSANPMIRRFREYAITVVMQKP